MTYYVIYRSATYLADQSNPEARVWAFDTIAKALKKLRELQARGEHAVIAKETSFGQPRQEPSLAMRLNDMDCVPMLRHHKVVLVQRANEEAGERDLPDAEVVAKIGEFETSIGCTPNSWFHYVAWVFLKTTDEKPGWSAYYDPNEHIWV